MFQRDLRQWAKDKLGMKFDSSGMCVLSSQSCTVLPRILHLSRVADCASGLAERGGTTRRRSTRRRRRRCSTCLGWSGWTRHGGMQMRKARCVVRFMRNANCWLRDVWSSANPGGMTQNITDETWAAGVKRFLVLHRRYTRVH